MSAQRNWICDGVPKDGKQYYTSGPHPNHQNSTPDCEICALPEEAMNASKIIKTQQVPGTPGTTVSQRPGNNIPVPALIAGGVAIALIAGFGLYKILQPGTDNKGNLNQPSTTSTNSGNPQGFVSENAPNAQLISQGEKILLTGTKADTQKTSAATVFTQKNWDGAIASYQQATTSDPNDPEAKIYLNNAKAKKAGNPLTIAVVVPISPNANSSKEILRGVSQAQEEFNQSPPTAGSLLEVVIANDIDPVKAANLGQDLKNSSNVLAVLGHGIDDNSKQAISMYEQAGLTVLSPITISVKTNGNQSTLQTVSIAQKANEVLGTYLQSVGKTLVNYATTKHTPASIVIFYDSDSAYSKQIKEQFTNAATAANAKILKEVDIKGSSFNAATELKSASQSGANVAFLAMGQNKVDQAVDIAKANTQKPLTLIGGNELYNPAILIQGGDAIKGIVLAVPWSSQSNDPFAQQATSIWKGRVSWRTTTAYDTTKALAKALSQSPSRAGVNQLLKQGIPISGTATDFNVFDKVPLVEAVLGKQGPPGSKYQFDPIK